MAERTGTSQEHYAALAAGFTKNGIESARRLLTKLPDTSSEPATSSLHEGISFEESADRPTARLYQALLPQFFETDPQATADWVTSLPDVKAYVEITSTFVRLWADHAPADAADWATTEHPAALPTVTQAWLLKADSEAKD